MVIHRQRVRLALRAHSRRAAQQPAPSARRARQTRTRTPVHPAPCAPKASTPLRQRRLVPTVQQAHTPWHLRLVPSARPASSPRSGVSSAWAVPRARQTLTPTRPPRARTAEREPLRMPSKSNAAPAQRAKPTLTLMLPQHAQVAKRESLLAVSGQASSDRTRGALFAGASFRRAVL